MIRISLLLLCLGCVPGLVAQQQVRFPDDFDDALVGSEVVLTNDVYVVSTYGKSLNGTVIVADRVLRAPTDEALPGSADYQSIVAANSASQLSLLASGFDCLDADGTLRVGQSASGLRGVVGKSGSRYTLTPTVAPVFAGNARTARPAQVEGSNLRVASFNMEYYLASPSSWGSGYGASGSAQFERQHAKLLAALLAMDADVYALCEVEEGAYTVAYLVEAMNEACGSRRYAYIDSGDDEVSTYTKNVFVYNTQTVSPFLDFKTYDYYYLKLRHVVQCFELKQNGARIVLSLNHFKAKSGSGSGANADKGDGQGSYNAQRVTEAEKCVEFYNSVTQYYGDDDVLVLGDLNSYTLEDPIRTFADAGFDNQLTRFAPDGYSYVYNSAVGYLDHSLASQSLVPQVVGAAPWHINADEPLCMGYDCTVETTPTLYRCSDHNPIITSLKLTGGSSVDDIAAQPRLTLSGNPANGFVTLHGRAISRAEVRSMSGRCVARHANPVAGAQMVLPCSGLARGVYVVVATVGGGTESVRMVVR